MVGSVDVGGRVVVYRKFSGGQRPAETTEARSKELSPRLLRGGSVEPPAGGWYYDVRI